jgi:hypothetical protein
MSNTFNTLGRMTDGYEVLVRRSDHLGDVGVGEK